MRQDWRDIVRWSYSYIRAGFPTDILGLERFAARGRPGREFGRENSTSSALKSGPPHTAEDQEPGPKKLVPVSYGKSGRCQGRLRVLVVEASGCAVRRFRLCKASEPLCGVHPRGLDSEERTRLYRERFKPGTSPEMLSGRELAGGMTSPASVQLNLPVFKASGSGFGDALTK